MLKMFVLSLSLYNIRNQGVFLLCKITNLLIYSLEESDTDEIKKYKDLLNKEYSFCVKIIDEVIEKVNKLYGKQMDTGKISKFCCDFKKLEEVADKYKNLNWHIRGERNIHNKQNLVDKK